MTPEERDKIEIFAMALTVAQMFNTKQKLDANDIDNNIKLAQYLFHKTEQLD